MIAAAVAPLVKLAAGAVLTLAVGFAGGWLVNGWRLESGLSELRAQHAEKIATQAKAALTTLQADAAAIHIAAGQLATIETTLGPKIDALKKEIRNAKPLPAGCLPDPARVRNLDAAIDAANAAAAGR